MTETSKSNFGSTSLSCRARSSSFARFFSSIDSSESPNARTSSPATSPLSKATIASNASSSSPAPKSPQKPLSSNPAASPAVRTGYRISNFSSNIPSNGVAAAFASTAASSTRSTYDLTVGWDRTAASTVGSSTARDMSSKSAAASVSSETLRRSTRSRFIPRNRRLPPRTPPPPPPATSSSSAMTAPCASPTPANAACAAAHSGVNARKLNESPWSCTMPAAAWTTGLSACAFGMRIGLSAGLSSSVMLSSLTTPAWDSTRALRYRDEKERTRLAVRRLS
mmetsp:Transcript_836/g.3075  ORF Transcript_836/g.3075 Transcript_836/m.3075 type:complete len:281 (-) Transcript_836:3197-4039(-)